MYERRWADDMLEPIRVDDRHVAVPWRDGQVTLIDVPTGDIVWQTDMPDGPFAERNRAYDEEWMGEWDLSVARHGSMSALVVLHDGRVDVLDTWTGAIRWSHYSAARRCIGRARGVGGAVLVSYGCEGKTTEGVALSTEVGTPLWRFTDAELDPQDSRDLGEDRLVSIDDDGGLTARRAADGKILWRVRSAGLNDPYEENFGVSADLLTVYTKSGITAFRISDSGIAWHRDMGDGDGFGESVLTNGLVTYARADVRTLVKLDARTGRVIDRHRFDEEISLKSMHGDLAVIDVGTTQERLIG